MTNMKARFLTELRAHADAWHEGDIDFATFLELRDATWHSIREAGPVVEDEVLRTLRDQLPTAKPGAPTHIRLIMRVESPTNQVAKTSCHEKSECHE